MVLTESEKRLIEEERREHAEWQREQDIIKKRKESGHPNPYEGLGWY